MHSVQNKTSPERTQGACNFTANINTNHQRKNFRSKAFETFLLYRRSSLNIVTESSFFNIVLMEVIPTAFIFGFYRNNYIYV